MFHLHIKYSQAFGFNSHLVAIERGLVLISNPAQGGVGRVFKVTSDPNRWQAAQACGNFSFVDMQSFIHYGIRLQSQVSSAS